MFRKTVLLLSVAAFLAALAQGSIIQAQTRTDAMGHQIREGRLYLADNNMAFAVELYKQLSKGKGNLFFSPHSISTVMAMVWAGARGGTEEEMAEVLHFKRLGQTKLHRDFAELEAKINESPSRGGVKLITANAIWPDRSFTINRPFSELLRARYQSEVRSVDFAKSTEEARRTINLWVKENTGGKIPTLFKPGILTAVTRLVLTNAIYFKGDWVKKFDPAKTERLPFTLSSGDQVDVPMMRQKGNFHYYEESGLQVLSLYYSMDSVRMTILLPEKGRALPDLETQLDKDLLSPRLPLQRGIEVDVTLPRFKTGSRFHLNKALKEMGIRKAFDSSADFTGMSPEKPLFLSAMVHLAGIEVDEKGTTAVAATGGVMAGGIPRHGPAVFRADRPFIFVIQGPSNEILFMGRIVDPR